MHNFLITSAKVLRKSVDSPNLVDVDSLIQASASRPDGPATPLVLRVAFLILPASNEANLIGCTSSGLSGNN